MEKKQALAVLLICDLMDYSESNITPRLHTRLQPRRSFSLIFQSRIFSRPQRCLVMNTEQLPIKWENLSSIVNASIYEILPAISYEAP